MSRTACFVLTLFSLLLSACSRGEKITPRPTEEEPPALASVVQVSDPRLASQLVRGFHDIEQNAWRWTMGSFAAKLRPPRGAERTGARLELRFSLPDVVLSRVKSVPLSAKVEGQPLTPQTYTNAGEQLYQADVSAGVLNKDLVTVEVSLDKFLAGGQVEARELGVIVSSIGLIAP